MKTDPDKAAKPVRELIIVGAGGVGSKVLETVSAINRQVGGAEWTVIGFVDEDESRLGETWDGLPIIATPDSLPEVTPATAFFVCAVGDNADRQRIARRVEGRGYTAATLVHPSSVVADSALLGRGVYIDALTVVAANAWVGDFVLINMQVGIGHHARLGEYSQICPGGKLGGYSEVGAGAFVGTNASVLPGKKVGAGAVIAAVSMVAQDVPDGESVMGIPARRFLKRRQGGRGMITERRAFTVLISSAGRRTGLIDCFRAAAARLGIELRVLAGDAKPELSPACALADAAFLLPPVKSPVYGECLKEICRREKVDMVVPTIDNELAVFASLVDEFRSMGCDLLVSGERTVGIARSKLETARVLGRQGLTVPRTALASEVLANPAAFTWPAIFKPIGGSASAGIMVFAKPENLPSARDLPEYIAQEYIHGSEFTVNIYFDRNGRLLAAVPHERLETRAGEVSKGVTRRNETLLRVAGQIAAALPNPRGPLCFQCILPADGVPRVFEINARFGGGYPLADRAGARFAQWLLEEALGLPSSTNNEWREGVTMLRYDSAVFING